MGVLSAQCSAYVCGDCWMGVLRVVQQLFAVNLVRFSPALHWSRKSYVSSCIVSCVSPIDLSDILFSLCSIRFSFDYVAILPIFIHERSLSPPVLPHLSSSVMYLRHPYEEVSNHRPRFLGFLGGGEETGACGQERAAAAEEHQAKHEGAHGRSDAQRCRQEQHVGGEAETVAGLTALCR